MKKTLLVICIMLLCCFVNAETDQDRARRCINDSLTHAVNEEADKQWEPARMSYDGAAICYGILKDYDNAVKYELKAAEMNDKGGRSATGLHYIAVAEYYAKKGPGSEDMITEYCDLAEQDLLKKIDDYLKQSDSDYVGYSRAYSSYRSLADCYKQIKNMNKTCTYCSKYKEYLNKAGEKYLGDCETIYLCPKSTSGSEQGSESNILASPNSPISNGGSAITLLAIGGLILLVLIAAFFLLKGKKRKSK